MSVTRFGLVMEQTLGHVTHCQNLRAAIESDPTVCATWFDVPYRSSDRWERVPVVRSNWSLRASLRARDCLRQADLRALDALLIHTQVSSLLCTNWMRQIPTVVSLDATPANKDRGQKKDQPPAPWWARFKRVWTRRALDAAAAIISWNQWSRRSLIDEYQVPAEKIAVIPPGVALDFWQPAPSSHGARLPRLLFVGGDFERKGGPLLVDLVHRELATHWGLDVVTHSQAVESTGAVRVHRQLPPNSPALQKLFAEADLLVLPTYWDCMPLVILEAMASGLPVVASDVGAISEQVIHGETGLLVPPGDRAALRQALETLARDPLRRRAMGAVGRARAEACFDAQKNAAAVVALLKACQTRPFAGEVSSCRSMASANVPVPPLN